MSARLPVERASTTAAAGERKCRVGKRQARGGAQSTGDRVSEDCRLTSSPRSGGRPPEDARQGAQHLQLHATVFVRKYSELPATEHAGNTSTVNSVLDLPAVVVPYKSPFLQQRQFWQRQFSVLASVTL